MNMLANLHRFYILVGQEVTIYSCIVFLKRIILRMSLFRNLGHQELMIVKVYFIDRIERDFTFSH